MWASVGRGRGRGRERRRRGGGADGRRQWWHARRPPAAARPPSTPSIASHHPRSHLGTRGGRAGAARGAAGAQGRPPAVGALIGEGRRWRRPLCATGRRAMAWQASGSDPNNGLPLPHTTAPSLGPRRPRDRAQPLRGTPAARPQACGSGGCAPSRPTHLAPSRPGTSPARPSDRPHVGGRQSRRHWRARHGRRRAAGPRILAR